MVVRLILLFNFSKLGGGVGINLTNLREAGAPIKGIEGAASGVVPVMKLLEDSFFLCQSIRTTSGSWCCISKRFHPDIVSFLSAKKENADEKIRVKTLSLGVVVPDKFYDLIKHDEDMYLFSPYSVEKVYGEPYAYVDITKEYDNMVKNPAIKKFKLKPVTSKMKFLNFNRNLAILTLLTLIRLIEKIQLWKNCNE